MPIIDATHLRTLQRDLYSAAGFPEDQAHIVADHLVDANLYGHDSHGVIRTPGYIRAITSAISNRTRTQNHSRNPGLSRHRCRAHHRHCRRPQSHANGDRPRPRTHHRRRSRPPIQSHRSPGRLSAQSG